MGRRLRIIHALRRHPFSVNCEIFTSSLLQLEMNSKISRNEYRHSHSKNSHGLENQIYIFVLGFFKCFITNYITHFFTYLFRGLKMFLMFDLTRQSLHELFEYSYACLDKVYSSVVVYVYQTADLPNSFQPCWKKREPYTNKIKSISDCIRSGSQTLKTA